MTNTIDDVVQAALNGVEEAVRLQEHLEWYFNRVRPEYVLTVEVARALINHHRSEAYTEEWKALLECPTRTAVSTIVAGGTRIFKNKGAWKKLYRELDQKGSFRTGRIDILVTHEPDMQSCPDSCYVVEVKGLNPPTPGIREDLKRIGLLLAVGGAENRLMGGLITFVWTYTGQYTSPEKRVRDLRKSLKKECGEYGVELEIHTRAINTTTGPEDGVPIAYGFCLVVKRKTNAADVP